jgi:hypothetical protein
MRKSPAESFKEDLAVAASAMAHPEMDAQLAGLQDGLDALGQLQDRGISPEAAAAHASSDFNQILDAGTSLMDTDLPWTNSTGPNSTGPSIDAALQASAAAALQASTAADILQGLCRAPAQAPDQAPAQAPAQDPTEDYLYHLVQALYLLPSGIISDLAAKDSKKELPFSAEMVKAIEERRTLDVRTVLERSDPAFVRVLGTQLIAYGQSEGLLSEGDVKTIQKLSAEGSDLVANIRSDDVRERRRVFAEMFRMATHRLRFAKIHRAQWYGPSGTPNDKKRKLVDVEYDDDTSGQRIIGAVVMLDRLCKYLKDTAANKDHCTYCMSPHRAKRIAEEEDDEDDEGGEDAAPSHARKAGNPPAATCIIPAAMAKAHGQPKKPTARTLPAPAPASPSPTSPSPASPSQEESGEESGEEESGEEAPRKAPVQRGGKGFGVPPRYKQLSIVTDCLQANCKVFRRDDKMWGALIRDELHGAEAEALKGGDLLPPANFPLRTNLFYRLRICNERGEVSVILMGMEPRRILKPIKNPPKASGILALERVQYHEGKWYRIPYDTQDQEAEYEPDDERWEEIDMSPEDIAFLEENALAIKRGASTSSKINPAYEELISWEDYKLACHVYHDLVMAEIDKYKEDNGIEIKGKGKKRARTNSVSSPRTPAAKSPRTPTAKSPGTSTAKSPHTPTKTSAERTSQSTHSTPKSILRKARPEEDEEEQTQPMEEDGEDDRVHVTGHVYGATPRVRITTPKDDEGSAQDRGKDRDSGTSTPSATPSKTPVIRHTQPADYRKMRKAVDKCIKAELDRLVRDGDALAVVCAALNLRIGCINGNQPVFPLPARNLYTVRKLLDCIRELVLKAIQVCASGDRIVRSRDFFEPFNGLAAGLFGEGCKKGTATAMYNICTLLHEKNKAVPPFWSALAPELKSSACATKYEEAWTKHYTPADYATEAAKSDLPPHLFARKFHDAQAKRTKELDAILTTLHTVMTEFGEIAVRIFEAAFAADPEAGFKLGAVQSPPTSVLPSPAMPSPAPPGNTPFPMSDGFRAPMPPTPRAATKPPHPATLPATIGNVCAVVAVLALIDMQADADTVEEVNEVLGANVGNVSLRSEADVRAHLDSSRETEANLMEDDDDDEVDTRGCTPAAWAPF